MTKSSKNTAVQSTVDSLQERTMALPTTSAKIRFLLGEGKTIKEIYRLFKEYNVLTKDGNEVRYQMVRNIALMPVGKK